jgi:hypothetical protein
LQSHENDEIHHKALAILEQYFFNYVSDSILWLLKNITSMTTTTVHIRNVFVDNFTILLRFSNIIFMMKSLFFFRFIVFLLFFLIFDSGRETEIPSWRNLHRRVAVGNSTTIHLNEPPKESFSF